MQSDEASDKLSGSVPYGDVHAQVLANQVTSFDDQMIEIRVQDGVVEVPFASIELAVEQRDQFKALSYKEPSVENASLGPSNSNESLDERQDNDDD